MGIASTTFDVVDRKQARRTNSSSPLGELFDHGCDALACAFEALAFGSTAMCGRSTFWFWVISAVSFYGATWEQIQIEMVLLKSNVLSEIQRSMMEGGMLLDVNNVYKYEYR
ncbi:hypothetical protein RJ639_006681 [Escallonia herrerae]|uniref:Uncharacterized protein n=1 Tax=Escallonia herrerae TaxID=1293975 RepID=A0AA88VX57_9ASTE|nr:hypothetical protein RJ639_006681 [Escallonia herrerae]